MNRCTKRAELIKNALALEEEDHAVVFVADTRTAASPGHIHIDYLNVILFVGVKGECMCRGGLFF